MTMRSSARLSATVVVLAATLSLPIVTWAQAPASPPGQIVHGAVRHHDGRAMPDRVAQRIDELHAQLKITPEQQASWDAFAQVMRNNAQHMQQIAEDRASKIKSMSASENMLSYAQIATQHAQDLQALASAFQPLYASLTPDQQRIADTMFRDVGMHHVHGGHRG